MQHRLTSLGLLATRQIQKMSVVAKAMCGVILLFYFLSFIPIVDENLAMTPAYIGPPKVKIWTIITAVFYENRILMVVLDIIAIIGFSSLLEPLWGADELMLFTCLVGVVSLVSGVLVTVIGYAIIQSYFILFSPFHGLAAVVCGYVVAVKQLHPDSVPLPPPAPPTLRVKHLPIMLVLITLFLSLLGVVSFSSFWLVLSGIAVSWIYLRFYQKREQDSRGDMTESFAFATFFPEVVQPPLAWLGGFVFHLLVSVKVCKNVRTYDVSASSTIKLSLPGTHPVDVQRRKQRALKALDERLKKSDEPLNWPSLEEGGSSSQEEHPPYAQPPTPPTGQLESVVVDKLAPVQAELPVTSTSQLSLASQAD